jgi:glycosyltransferase involved in cell wall biosynthesis
MNSNSIFLIVQMPVKIINEEIYLEQGVFIGIEKWAENFDEVTIGLPIYRDIDNRTTSTFIWKRAVELNCYNRVNIIKFERVFSTLKFIKSYIKKRKEIRDLIKNNKYLCFAGGGFKGDWGTVAAIEAMLLKRKYAAWTDRVEYNVLLENIKKEKIIKKIKKITIDYTMMKLFFKFMFRNAEIALLHGNDCFIEFKEMTKNPFLVHNIHISSEFKIKEDELIKKIDEIEKDKKIKISYAGRVSYEKGVYDWIQVAEKIIQKYDNVEFSWYGDGEEIEKVKKIILEKNINNKIKFYGFMGDKKELYSNIKESDIFMFCHKTKESPRNLIEALILGTPIVGYKSEYPEDLIKENKGGVLIEKDNIEQLYNVIEELIIEKNKIKKLIENATKDGKNFDITEVFKHRSDLIKEYL